MIVKYLADLISSFDPPRKDPQRHWYLTPEAHVIDAFCWIPFFVVIVSYAWLLEKRHRARRPLTTVWPESRFARLVCQVLSWILSVCLCAQVYYKYHRGNLAMVYMLQPCHVAAAIYVYLLRAERTRFNGMLYNVSTQFMFFTVLALAVPDTSQLSQFLEHEVFWIEHWTLLLAPLYLIVLQHFPLYEDFACYLHALGWGGLFFYLVQLPCGLISGVNLNYMLWPPPRQPIQGPYYRTFMGMFLIFISFTTGHLFPRLLVKIVNSLSAQPPRGKKQN